MTQEKLRSENYPNILEDPVGFVDRVKELRSNNDPGDQSAFKEWLLDQWTKINLKISTTPYKDFIRPNGEIIGSGIAILSDSISLTQRDTYRLLANIRIELLYASQPSLSLDNKNSHIIRISFITGRRKNRNLDKVVIEEQFLGINPESKPLANRNRLVINISPFTIVPANNNLWDFLSPPNL